MAKKWESVFFIGLLLIPFILVILFYSPAAQAREMYVNVVNTNEWLEPGDSGDVSIAKLKLGLNEQHHLDNFPHDIETYHGTDVKDTDDLQELLQADTLLMRTYRRTDTAARPIYLVIVHSTNAASAHPPANCYAWAGYDIVDKGQVSIPLHDTDLISRMNETGETDEAEDGGSLIDILTGGQDSGASITVNTLIAAMTENGTITERRLVYYTYLADKEFLVSEYCLLRVSAIIPDEGPYDDIAVAMQGFMANVFSLLFEDVRVANLTLFNQFTERGGVGIALLSVIFLIPAVMIVYPLATRKIFFSGKKKKKETEATPDDIPEEPVFKERVFILPHNPDEKSGNEKILAEYYNSRYVIEQCIDIDTGSASTLRQFLTRVSPAVPEDVSSLFTVLTKLAETAVYAKREPDENAVTEAGKLADEILRIMKDVP